MTTPAPRVLRIIARLNVGGPARHVVILDEGLRARGFGTLLAHGDVGAGEASMESLARDAGIPTRRIAGLGRTVRPLDDVRAFAALVGLVFSYRPDVVHTHTAKAGSLGRVAAWLYNLTRPRRRRCLVVHTFHGHVLHGYFSPSRSAIVRGIERGLARLTDAVLVLSPRLQQEIAVSYRVAPARKVHVVPLGLQLESLLSLERAEAPAAGDREVVFGYVGRLVPVKNLPMLLEAFSRVRARVPCARLVLVGDGELADSLRETAGRLGIADWVAFTGWRSDLREVYAGVDAVVLTSVNEGTPVAAIEAMAAGLPVVATAVGGVPDVITDGENGLLVPSGDVVGMAAAMERLAVDAAVRHRLGRSARRTVEGRYSASRLVSDVEGLYRRCLDAKRGMGARR